MAAARLATVDVAETSSSSAKHGGKVAFCSPDEEDGLKLQSELNSRGTQNAFFVKCDVTKEADVKNLVETVVGKFSRLDCLVNNAGIHPQPCMIEDSSVEVFRKVMEVNVVGYFLTSKYCMPHLRKSKGSIVNNASLVAHIGQRGSPAYAASKGAILAMTKAMAIDEAKFGVRVNSVSISTILTPLWMSEISHLSLEEQERMKECGREVQVLGRFGTYEEAGLTFLFLAEDATFCTGEDVKCSGGAELDYGKKSQLGQEGFSKLG